MLRGPGDQQQLLVTLEDGKWRVDATRQARYRAMTPNVVRVTSAGTVVPLANGRTRLEVTVDGITRSIEATVAGFDVKDAISFELDIQPVLTKEGCNSGPCHGKSGGQNGFQLSLLGFDSDFDYDAIVKEARGRRVFPGSPDHSLLLRKPLAVVAHGGGRRLERGGYAHGMLRRWISAGQPRERAGEPHLERIAVAPTARSARFGEEQQLGVTAFYSDGSRRDVTHLADYQSSESPLAAVDNRGLIQVGKLPGEATIMARFMHKIGVCTVSIPLPGEVEGDYAQLPRFNFIDKLTHDKLELLGLWPSGPTDDATFARRVYVDIIGRLPSADETRDFLRPERAPEFGSAEWRARRTELVDRLLQSPEYGDFWANKWVDLLRPNPYRVGIKAVRRLDAWLRDVFRENLSYDEFVRQLITAQGSTFRDGATVVFRDRRSPDELASVFSRLFLGTRLECAKCHHHPFERWAQSDFYSLAAFFARVRRKGTGLSPPISGSEEFVFASESGEVRHPRTGEVLPPRAFFGEVERELYDRREALMKWMVSDGRMLFARVMVNRVWRDLMGRGLVEPVDDLRTSNPPSNGPLLDALAEDLCRQGYDLKKLIRTIATSYVYGLSSIPNERNVMDTRNYSRYYRERLRAEVLLDSVCAITGVEESFAAMPQGSRATAIWTHRVPSLFLDTFGRPDRNQDPPCERLPDTSVVQALHLMNAPRLHGKVVSDQGRAARLAASERTPEAIVEELYLSIYNRFPAAEEVELAVGLFGESGAKRREVTEDLMWAMLNTPEFQFKR